jgi:hypothetical protein
MAALAVLVSVGCATTAQNNYAEVVKAQQGCCNKLTDPTAKNACLTDIPRVQGEPMSSLNQETFGCVLRNFSCDASSGRATKESAQGQLDCLNDLESTQQAHAQGQL